MKTAIYARFSSDKQSDQSTADQHRACASFAESRGWLVVAAHSDDAISGSVPVLSRPGSRALLADAMAGRFEVLLLEGLDRLSRDSVDQEQTVRRLEHRGIRIIGICDGYDSEAHGRKLHRAMRGIINEVYLDDLRDKTHRGLTGKALNGHHTGGMSYGYTSVPDGTGKRLEINPAQASTVVQIFELYALQRWSVERITYHLNERQIPSPRGGLFNNRLDCACELSDLAPCDAMQLRCEAGYKHARENGDFVVTDSPEPMTDSDIDNLL